MRGIRLSFFFFSFLFLFLFAFFQFLFLFVFSFSFLFFGSMRKLAIMETETDIKFIASPLAMENDFKLGRVSREQVCSSLLHFFLHFHISINGIR